MAITSQLLIYTVCDADIHDLGPVSGSRHEARPKLTQADHWLCAGISVWARDADGRMTLCPLIFRRTAGRFASYSRSCGMGTCKPRFRHVHAAWTSRVWIW